MGHPFELLEVDTAHAAAADDLPEAEDDRSLHSDLGSYQAAPSYATIGHLLEL
jgi:hypothetical protein